MMNNDIPEEQKNSFRTASMYHFFGTFGLVAASLTRYPAVVRFLSILIFLLDVANKCCENTMKTLIT